MRSRRGYTIHEILALLAVFLVILSLSAKMGWTLIREIPMTDRYFNTQTSVQSVLNSLRQDVETARNLQLSDETVRTLMTDNPDGRVLYEFSCEQMRRGPAEPNLPGELIWTLPDVRIDWRIKEKEQAKALEIRVWQQRTFLGKERIHFEQAHLFFVGLQNPGSGREE